jgi:hypothetical protein
VSGQAGIAYSHVVVSVEVVVPSCRHGQGTSAFAVGHTPAPCDAPDLREGYCRSSPHFQASLQPHSYHDDRRTQLRHGICAKATVCTICCGACGGHTSPLPQSFARGAQQKQLLPHNGYVYHSAIDVVLLVFIHRLHTLHLRPYGAGVPSGD